MDNTITAVISEYACYAQGVIGDKHYKSYNDTEPEPTVDELRSILSKVYYDLRSIIDMCELVDRAHRINHS